MLSCNKFYLLKNLLSMANSKSAKKRIRINKRNKVYNKYYKTSARNLTRAFFRMLELSKENEPNYEELKNLLNSIYSILDKGTKKRVFPKNKVTRQKARLAAYLKFL